MQTADDVKIVSGNAVHLFYGHASILKVQPALQDLCRRSHQPKGVEDLAYFLNKPGFLDKIETPVASSSGKVTLPHRLLRGVLSLVHLRRRPILLLVTERSEAASRELKVEDLIGCSLVYDYRALGMSIRAAATNDRSGRSTLIALGGYKAQVASVCIQALLEKGINLILMSTLEDTQRTEGSSSLLSLDLQSRGVRWTSRSRRVASYLPLASSYEETLASMGPRTRRNLRYYRKRAETDLGCVFVPEVEISEENFLSFNDECMYPVSRKVARWRYGSMSTIGSPFLSGVRHADGRWLSLVGGRRTSFGSEILWQLNREGLSAYSLGTVMRSYLIENEVRGGASRLYAEGGTDHSMSHAFMNENLVDVLVMRRSLSARVLRMIAERFVPSGNELVSMLSQDDVEWQLS